MLYSVLRKESLRVLCVIPAPACARVNDSGYPAFRLRVDSRIRGNDKYPNYFLDRVLS
jgi:hypothetical protein